MFAVLACDWLQKIRADNLFTIDSLRIKCAQSNGEIDHWPIVDDKARHNVKWIMVSFDDLKKYFDADDRTFIMHVNGADVSAKADNVKCPNL